MLVWGWWAFEILAFMASYISPAALAAQSCMRAIGLFTFMVPSGFSRSATTLIGNAIGAE
jgi:Na+-driven multidrug efflux pump